MSACDEYGCTDPVDVQVMYGTIIDVRHLAPGVGIKFSYPGQPHYYDIAYVGDVNNDTVSDISWEWLSIITLHFHSFWKKREQ